MNRLRMRHSLLLAAAVSAGALLVPGAAREAAADGGAPKNTAAAQPPAPGFAGIDTARLSPDDLKELDAMQQAIGMYEAASKDYRGTVSHIVKQEFEKKRRTLQARYDAQIKVVEKEEKQRRIDAIALFEKFLAKYPTDPRWTPDVLFRLAELYFERAQDEYLAAVDAAQKAADAAQKDPNAQPAPAAPPSPDYVKTIELYRRLISEFPGYRLADGAHYLLGYCLGEMTKEAEARQAFLALVCTNKYRALDPPPPPAPSKPRGEAMVFVDPYTDCKPIREDSRFLPETWTRVGEYHFDYNELELAIAAYARVLQFKDSPYYDKALYKLAWSYYRADKYLDGIKKFDELVLFSDQKKGESGKEGSDLRVEAVQYLGISFAEKDWNGDSVDDYPAPVPGDPDGERDRKIHAAALSRIDDFYRGREAEPHVHEIYQKLGDIFFDETEYLKAIAVYRVELEKWPLAADNPKVQDKIVLALERLRLFEEALKARGEIVRNYDKGSAWYNHNRDNAEALHTAAQLREMSVVKFAYDHHTQAQKLKKLAFATNPPDTAKLGLASKEYALAAEGYEKYLEQYQNTKNSYEYTYFYAETLYYSQRFADAAIQYEKVRDSNLDNKYLEDSAFNTVKSYEQLLELETKAGKMYFPPIPLADKVKGPVTPLEVPEFMRKLQSAYDAYVKVMPAAAGGAARIPTMAYKAAEIEFRYLNFDKARERMQGLIDKFCADPVSAQAGRAILTSFTIDNNLDKIVEWTNKLLQSKCGGAGGAVAAVPGTPAQPGAKPTDTTGELKTLLNDAKFQQAQKLLDAGKFEEAADAFVKVVDGNADNIGGNNDKALNNAAVGYEKVNRFAAATKIYERIVNEYPQSQFVDDALFRTAVNYQKFFEFDKAVVSYQRLATDARFKGSQHRTDSIYNAANILENEQDYDKAADLFQTYSRDPNVKREDQSEAFFRAGNIALKAKEPQKAMKVFGDYVKLFPGEAKREIEAQFRIAEAIEQQKGHKAALPQFKRVTEGGARVAAASDAAEFPAHAEFILAEEQLQNGLEKMKIQLGASKNAAAEFQKSFAKFKDEIARMTGEYNKVINYKRVTWTVAAFFRIGYTYELLSRALASILTAPCPQEVMRKYKQEGCDVYLQGIQDAIGPQVEKVDAEVVARYRTTLDQAAKLGVSNEWTRLTRQRANAFKPDEFPMIKDERVDFQMEAP